MSSVPRIVTKQIGLQRVDTIDPIELNRYLNDLERRMDALIPPVIQTELDDLQAEVDTDENNLAVHIVDTTTHGTTTAIVGVDDTQTLTNKDLRLKYATTATNLTLGTQTIVKVTAAVTITLPTAVGVTGKTYVIDNAHTGTTTVNPTGAETIEGEATQSLIGSACMVVYSDGANWRIG